MSGAEVRRDFKIAEQEQEIKQPRCSGCQQLVARVVKVCYPDPPNYSRGSFMCWGGPLFMFSLCRDCLKVALEMLEWEPAHD